MQQVMRIALGLVVTLPAAVGHPLWADGTGAIIRHLEQSPAAADSVAGKTSGPVEHLASLFPPTPVGHTSSLACFALCLTGNSGFCGGASGQASLATPVGSPFQLSNFRVSSLDASNPCAGTPTSLPVFLQLDQILVFDANFSPTSAGQFTSSAIFDVPKAAVSFDYFGSTVSSNCAASGTTLCLNYGRFSVTANWVSTTASGAGNAIDLTDDTGSFWFFSSSNIEFEAKVIDGCGLNGHYWFFAGGLTNVRVTITVTDTATGAVRVYHNPQGTAFVPIQDASAFATCP